MNNIISNGKLYIFDKEPQVISEDATLYYVPIESLNDYKKLNPDKPIEGYDYNCIKAGRPEYYDVDIIKFNKNSVDWAKDGMFVKEIQLTDRKIPSGYCFIVFPFDVTLDELKTVFEDTIKVWTINEFKYNYAYGILENRPVFNTLEDGSQESKSSNGLTNVTIQIRDIDANKQQLIRANTPIIMKCQTSHTVTANTEPLKFYNKVIKKYFGYVKTHDDWDIYCFINTNNYEYINNQRNTWEVKFPIINNATTGKFGYYVTDSLTLQVTGMIFCQWKNHEKDNN